MKIDCFRQVCAMKGVAICNWCGYLRKWCGYLLLVWLFAIGVAISFSVSRAPVGAKNNSEYQSHVHGDIMVITLHCRNIDGLGDLDMTVLGTINNGNKWCKQIDMP